MIFVSKEEFIKRANKQHNFKYDYSLVEYKTLRDKVKIICPIHGEFLQCAKQHTIGKGCKSCNYLNKKNKKVEDFFKQAKEKHNNKYIYDESSYISLGRLFTVYCKDHGAFEEFGICHLNSGGCQQCKLDKKQINFIKSSNKIHNNEYDYSKVIFKGTHTHVTIICKTHGEFQQTPKSHLKGHKCHYCANNVRKKLNQFIEESNKIHNYKYDYSKFEYFNLLTKGIVICKNHGEFSISPNHHIHRAQGCVKCTSNISNLENKWFDNLQINNLIRNKQLKIKYGNDIKVIKPDGFDPKTNTIYEFYGDYWHGNPDIFNSNDINRSTKNTYGYHYQQTLEREKIIKEAGYNLVTIWENDFNKGNL